jgi:uncharacterized protein (DUF4415 family)
MKNVSTGTIIPAEHSDWATVNAMTDADIHHDADSPRTFASDWDGALLKQSGVVIGQVKMRGKNKRPVKKQVAVRYDVDVLEAFKATGRGWQTRMNNALKDWLREHAA